MALENRSSNLTVAIVLALSFPLVSGCVRNVTSSPGGAPNLEVWAKQIQAKRPSGTQASLPLLQERTVFNYADNTIMTINPNPQAALDAAMANGQQQPSADPTSPLVLDMIRMAAKGGKSDGIVDEAAQQVYMTAWKAASDFYGLNRNDLIAAKSFLDKLGAAAGQSGLTGAALTEDQVAAGRAATTTPGLTVQEIPDVIDLPASPDAAAKSAPANESPKEGGKIPAVKSKAPSSDSEVKGLKAPAVKDPAPKAAPVKKEASEPALGKQVSVQFEANKQYAAVRSGSVKLFAAPLQEEPTRSRRAKPQPAADDSLPAVATSDAAMVEDTSSAKPVKVSAVMLAQAFTASAYDMRRAGFDLEQSLAFLATAPSIAEEVAHEFALAGPDTNRYLFDVATGRRVSPLDVLILSSVNGTGIDSLPAQAQIVQFRTDGGASQLKIMDAKLRQAGGGEAIRFLVQDRTIRKALRNPFELPVADETATPGQTVSARPDPSRARQVLEQFPLDALRMTGTMGKGSEITALIRAPDKTVYRVRLGQYVGQHDGKVVNIDNGGLDLVELIQAGSTGWSEQPASILMEN